jgi:hypothetical protein
MRSREGRHSTRLQLSATPFGIPKPNCADAAEGDGSPGRRRRRPTDLSRRQQLHSQAPSPRHSTTDANQPSLKPLAIGESSADQPRARVVGQQTDDERDRANFATAKAAGILKSETP